MQWFLKGLRPYADFSGRARRQEYWMYILFYTIFVLALVAVDAVLIYLTDSRWSLILSMIFSLAMLIPTLAVTVRRLHDTDRSGWWYLISFVPFGSIVILVFTVMEGTRGANQYGPDPKAYAQAW
ncbi:DUF805 domain-containing protein [Pseudonocardia sp. TRM90224]|uniref:DUF805 domain-containing protein n=1 Tax=Pseudonocardia sp. TRM90224 TaxID=2812678 RepID=UPI001E4F66BC|nr:DUF805 domain-containing protein [Pseudonocardia sp. TRM90224]